MLQVIVLPSPCHFLFSAILLNLEGHEYIFLATLNFHYFAVLKIKPKYAPLVLWNGACWIQDQQRKV